MTVERVVFLPGASGDASFWAPVAERLPHQLDRVLLAWPGLGNVPPRADVRGFADLLRLTLDTIDRDVALVAQSMGGIVALLATLERPERVRRLVLTATSGGIDVRRFGAADWRPDYRHEYPGAAPWIFDVSIDLTDRIPRITHLVVIPGGDHAFARERADDVAPHVARHLGQ